MAKRYIPGSTTPTGALTPEQEAQMEEDLLLQREEAEQAAAERQLLIAQPAAPLELPVEEDPLVSVRAALTGRNFQQLNPTQQSRIVTGAEPVAGVMPDITRMQSEEGGVLPTSEGRERYQEEVTEQAAESLQRTIPVDFQTEEELKAITKGGMRPTATGALFHMRLPLTKFLSEGRINQEDGSVVSNMEMAANLLGTNDYNRVLNAGVMGFTRLGVMALKHKEFDPDSNSMFDSIDNSVTGLFDTPIDQQVSEASMALQSGGVEANTFISMLGKSLYETVNPTPLNEFGLPIEAIVPYNENNAFKAGQIVTQALVDSGYLIEESRTTTPLPEGQNLEDQTAPRTKNPQVKVFLAGPKARRMIMGAKDYLLNVDPNELPTRSQLVPASQKGFVGARSELMGQDLEKGSESRLPKAVNKYKINLGSVGVQYDPRRLNALNFLNMIASDGNFANQYPEFAPIADTLLDIDRNQILAGNPEAVNAEDHNRRTRERTINYANKIAADGRTRYLPYKVDRSVNRVYPVSDDFNPQSYTHIRQIMTFTNRPLITVTKLGRGRNPNASLLSDSEIPDAGNLQKLLSLSQNERNELDLLYAIESALSPVASRHLPERTLADITENKLNQYAEIGGLLKTVFDSENMPEAFMDLPQESQVKLLEMFKGLNHKNWGMRTSAYMAAHSYVNQPQLNDLVLLEADQRSAGRTFLAMDIGETQVLKRTGVFYAGDSEFSEGAFDARTIDFLADGTPRTYFAAEAEFVFEDHFAKLQGKEGHSYNHGGTIRATLSDLLETRPKFADDFGKKVLMVTDYGKAISAHRDAAYGLFEKYPELLEGFQAEGYTIDSASIQMAEIFKTSLGRVTDSAQRNVPKSMALIQGFLGTKPRPVGYFKEIIPFGKQKLTTRKSGLMTSSGLELVDVSREADFAARGVTKTFKDRQEDGTIRKTTYVPNAYTSVTNMVGPVKGQYREQIVNVEGYNGLTEVLGETPNAVPVHDNFIKSNKDLLLFTYFLNEVGTRKALEWNMHMALEKDFTESVNKAVMELPNEIRMEEGSDFFGFLQYMDEQVDFIENRVKDPDDDTILPSIKKGDFIKKIEVIIQAAKDELGYEDYRTRDNDVLVVNKDKYVNFIQRYFLNDKAFKAQRASLFTRSNDAQESSDRSIVLNQIRKQKRLGFMIPNADG